MTYLLKKSLIENFIFVQRIFFPIFSNENAEIYTYRLGILSYKMGSIKGDPTWKCVRNSITTTFDSLVDREQQLKTPMTAILNQKLNNLDKKTDKFG